MQGGASGDPRYRPGIGRHARGPVVRRDRRKVPRHATDLLRTAYRGRPQSQRAAEDLIGWAFLRVSDEAVGAAVSAPRRAHNRNRRTVWRSILFVFRKERAETYNMYG